MDTFTGTARQITLNGEAVSISAATLGELLAKKGYGAAKVATALNGEFVPAAQRASTPIKSGDRIEIVSPRQGG